MGKQNACIYAVIDGQKVSREQIRQAESARYKIALKTLGLKIDADKCRERILQAKLDRGQEQIKAKLYPQLIAAKATAALLAKLSHGKRTLSGIDFFAEGIGAKDFVEWFERQSQLNNTAAMLQAHPEHYVIDNRPGATQYVCETTGGSPLASEFTICFGNTEAITIPLREYFPYRIEGVSVLKSGLCIGGARHQFEETETGLHGFLCIDFPRHTPSAMINGHKWHLAIEFSNWVEAALSGKYDHK